MSWFIIVSTEAPEMGRRIEINYSDGYADSFVHTGYIKTEFYWRLLNLFAKQR